MSRTIIQGDRSTYIEKADAVTVNQNVGSRGNTKIPATLSAEQWSELLSFMTEFIESKEAESLNVQDYKKIVDEISVVETLDYKTGWQKFHEFLGDAANFTTLLTSIVPFISANSGQIAQWIQNIF
jgi:hypothetical protein